MIILQAVVARQIRIPLRDSLATAGLLIGDFTFSAFVNGSRVADPETSWSMALSEVDSVNLPGVYELRLTPTTAGLLYLRAVDNDDNEWHLQVAHEGVDLIGRALYGAEGTYTLTVTDSGDNPVEGVLVRVFTSTGSRQVARGYTDASGEVEFELPTGTYQTRYSKTGWDFSGVNPTEITVTADDTVAPALDQLLPSSAGVGDTVAVQGQFFVGDNVTVLFGDTPTSVTPDEVSSDGTLLVFTVPSGSGSTTIRVRQDDPNNPGEYLTSSDSLILTVS